MVSVLDGGFSVDGDSFSVTPQSLNLFNEYTGNIRPFPSLPEDKRSGIVFHHKAKSSEVHSIVRQTSSTTLGPRDHFVATYSIPLWLGNPLSTINLSEANTAEGSYPSVDGRVQDGLNKLPIPNKRENQEEARMDGQKKSSPGLSAEGSGSGSGLSSNRFSQEFEGVTTVNHLSTLSSINFKVGNTGEKSRSTGIKMDSETDEEAGSKIIGKKERELEAKNESELSSEEEEKVGEGEAVNATGNRKVRKMVDETDESARRLNSAAGCDTLNEKEREAEVETVMGTVMNSGEEIDFGVFSRPLNIHGSGDGGERGEGGHGKGMKVGGDNKGIKAAGGKQSGDRRGGREDGRREVVSGRRDGLQLSIRQDGPTAELPLFDSSEEDGDGDEYTEEERNVSLDSRDVSGTSTLENNIERDGDGKRLKIGGGGEDDTAAVTKESSQQSESVDRLLFDAARSPVLRHLVPLFTLTDGSKATDERMEGKCLSMLSFSSALPLCDRM